MQSDRIIEILSDWNFWDKKQETGFLREDYISQILKVIKSGKIISIIGVRRGGKSTLIKQIVKKLTEKIPVNDTLIINFEEPQFANIDLPFLIKIYESYLEVIKPSGKPFIFLDEIQNLTGWERFVRGLNEKKEAHIVISGSSSKLLSEELATLLTGRQLYFEVLPLSFKEFLHFRGIETSNLKDVLVQKLKIKQLLREYMESGGFPEIVLNENDWFRKKVLLSYYEDIVNRDLIQRFGIKKIQQFKVLTHFYLTNISSPITFGSIAKYIKLPVETIRRFSSYIELSNLVFFLKRFSFSLKEQENSPRKVYSIDTGLSNAVGFRFSKDYGKIAENIVSIQLRHLQKISPDMEIYYWKNQYNNKEVDFVIKEGLEIKNLVQVCWNISDEKTKRRKIHSLLKAMDEFKLNSGLIITEDHDDEILLKGKKIVFISLWKYLSMND